MSFKAKPTNNQTVQYGVHPPISLEGPGKADEECTAALEQLLEESNLYETEEQSAHREDILGKLNVLVQEWMREESIKAGAIDSNSADTLGQVYTFGSFRLGVSYPGADMDTLIIGPKHIDRSLFFAEHGFVGVLRTQETVVDLSVSPLMT